MTKKRAPEFLRAKQGLDLCKARTWPRIASAARAVAKVAEWADAGRLPEQAVYAKVFRAEECSTDFANGC